MAKGYSDALVRRRSRVQFPPAAPLIPLKLSCSPLFDLRFYYSLHSIRCYMIVFCIAFHRLPGAAASFSDRTVILFPAHARMRGALIPLRPPLGTKTSFHRPEAAFGSNGQHGSVPFSLGDVRIRTSAMLTRSLHPPTAGPPARVICSAIPRHRCTCGRSSHTTRRPSEVFWHMPPGPPCGVCLWL